MSDIRFTNFARSTLAVGVTSGDTILALAGGGGAAFPALVAGQYFYATLEDAQLNREIVRVTGRTVDSLLVVRGQDNTAARPWTASASVSLRLNAAAMQDHLTQTAASQTAAANSEATATNAATSATVSQTAAANSATTAGNSATAAAASQTAAGNSATNAAASATTAGNAATSATASQTAAANSATAAAGSATSAANSAADAAASAAVIDTANFVQVIGDQTIGGVKAFSSPPVVPADSFSFAQLQNIPTATILGRSSAGTGDVEPLTGAQATALLSAASETVSGRVELADATEAAAGTNGTNALTPLRLRDALAATGSAPIYACRAWVNFNGTGTVAIRGSGNVSSITDNGVGIYTVNFTSAMPDVNYSTVVTSRATTNGTNWCIGGLAASSTTQVVVQQIITGNGGGDMTDSDIFNVAIFR